MCLYTNFQFSWWSRDHFSSPFCQMPDHRLSRLAKGTPSVSAFHRSHWFGVKLSCRLCAGQSRVKIIITRRMYWWQALIQDGRAFTSTWWHHCSETVFHDNFVIFRHRSKRIAVYGVSEFLYMCLYAYFQFSRWSHDHFSAPFRGLYMLNTWSQTLQTSKRHTFSLGFPSVPLVWGKTVSCRLCVGQSKGILKNAVFY